MIVKLIYGGDLITRRKSKVIDAQTIGLCKRISPTIIKETSYKETENDTPEGVAAAQGNSHELPDSCLSSLSEHTEKKHANSIVPLSYDIYPGVNMLKSPPLPIDFRKKWPDEELEDWATLSRKEREAMKEKLTIFLLKRGLSDFDYSTYGFTKLDLSQNALSDISLFLRLPMTFNSLSYVNLSYNKLTDISPLCALSTITHLDVSHNKLKKLLHVYPEFYWNVDEPENLNEIDCASKSLSQLLTRGWSLCGTGCSRLRWVNYSHNLVTQLEGGRHWAHYPRLAYLDLSYNRISDLRSEDRESSNCTAANKEGRCGAGCGLAKLRLLHTLDLSHNYISRVEGFNGLQVHNLILSGNTISSWEGETGSLYKVHDLRRVSSEDNVTEDISPGGDCGMPSRADEKMAERNFSKKDSSIERQRDAVLAGVPSLRIVRKRVVEFEEAAEEKETTRVEDDVWEVLETETAKELEVLYRLGSERKAEEVPLDVLYHSRKSKMRSSDQGSSSEEGGVLEQRLKEESIFKNWNDPEVKVVHFCGRVDRSEEEQGSGASAELRRAESSESGEASAYRGVFGGRGEARGEGEGAVGTNRSSGKGGVEVVYQRPGKCGWSDSGEEDVSERIYEEWDDPEVRVLYEGRWEGGVGRENDLRDTEESSEVWREWRKACQDDLQMLFPAIGGFAAGREDTGEDKPEERRLEVLYEHVRGDALVDEERVTESKSVEVLFRGDFGSDESTSAGERDDVVDAAEGCGPRASEDVLEVDLDVFEIGLDVYERAASVASEEGAEEGGAMAATASWSGATIVRSPRPKREDVGVYKRDEANRFKSHVGLRALQYLVELHVEHNNISSLRMFRGMYSLRSLFIQHNQVEEIGELIFLNDLHSLLHLDMTENPVSNCNGFEETVLFLHPSIRYLNNVDCSTLAGHVKREPSKLFWKNPFIRAARQTDDLLLASELCRDNYVGWSCPELESLNHLNAAYPTLFLVGPEGSGKEVLCQQLCDQLPDKTHLSPLSTTKTHVSFEVQHPLENEVEVDAMRRCFRFVTEDEFVLLMFSGSLASASHDGAFFYGFEKRNLRDAARKRKIVVAAVDLTTALALRDTGFGGRPRLVLVLPESSIAHEKTLRRKFRREKGMGRGAISCAGVETDGSESSSDERSALREEHEFVRRNLRDREECLTTHRDNPGVFEFGVFSDEEWPAMEKLKALVEEMNNIRVGWSLKEGEGRMSSWHEDGVPASVMGQIEERLGKELENSVHIWE